MLPDSWRGWLGPLRRRRDEDTDNSTGIARQARHRHANDWRPRVVQESQEMGARRREVCLVIEQVSDRASQEVLVEREQIEVCCLLVAALDRFLTSPEKPMRSRLRMPGKSQAGLVGRRPPRRPPDVVVRHENAAARAQQEQKIPLTANAAAADSRLQHLAAEPCPCEAGDARGALRRADVGNASTRLAFDSMPGLLLMVCASRAIEHERADRRASATDVVQRVGDGCANDVRPIGGRDANGGDWRGTSTVATHCALRPIRMPLSIPRSAGGEPPGIRLPADSRERASRRAPRRSGG